VESVEDDDIVCTVLNSGDISNNKGVNVPGAKLSIPFISDRDRSDLLFGIENGFDLHRRVLYAQRAGYRRDAPDTRGQRRQRHKDHRQDREFRRHREYRR
jgi:pyruvate kinase